MRTSTVLLLRSKIRWPYFFLLFLIGYHSLFRDRSFHTMMKSQSQYGKQGLDDFDCDALNGKLASYGSYDEANLEAIYHKNFPSDPMVIVFLHIAKTGGTTIRSYFGHRSSTIRSRLSLKKGDFERSSQAIQRHLKTGKSINKVSSSSTLFVEFHGQGLDAKALPHHIKIWRQQSRDHLCRLFIFTLWRHPVDHAISYYTYMLNYTDMSAKHINESPIYSRQSSTFAEPIKMPTHTIVTPWDGFHIYEQVLSRLDWIGTTESIDEVTVPLLDRLVGDGSTNYIPHKNVGRHAYHGTVHLDPELRGSIIQDSCVDHAIWKHLARGSRDEGIYYHHA